MGSIGLRANTGTRAKALQSGWPQPPRCVRSSSPTGPDVAVSASALDSVLALLGTDEAAIAHVVATPLPEPAYLAVKPFPTSGAAHSSIEVLLDVRSRFADGTIPTGSRSGFHLGGAGGDELRAAEGGRRSPVEHPLRRPSARHGNWAASTSTPSTTTWSGPPPDAAIPTGSTSPATPISRLVVNSHRSPSGAGRTSNASPGRATPRVSGAAARRRRLRAKFDRCLAAAGRSAAADAVWNGLAEAPFDTLSELNN